MPLLFALAVALDFDIDAISAEDSYQPHDDLAASVFTTAYERSGERAFVASSEADQAGGVLLQVVEGGGALGLDLLPHLEMGDEPAKVLIANPRLAEQGQARGFSETLVREPSGRRESISEAGHSNLRSHI